MNEEYDAVIVGGGPGGSTAARFAAESGARVLMLEKRQEIGSPVRCAEGVSRAWMREVGLELNEKSVAARVKGAKIVSPSGHDFYVDEEMAGSEVGLVLERGVFDKNLAAQAARAGADIMVKTAATGLIMEDGSVSGVKAVSHGEPLDIKTNCVVGADGFESQVGRWAGIDTTLKPTDITSCVQYRLADIEIESDYCEFTVGSAAPGGYVWIFPKGDDVANIGLGVQLSRLNGPGEVKAYLDKYIEEDDRLNKGQPLDAVAGAVSVSPPLEQTTADGLMLVGDAARIIDPITGGGIAHACLSGMYAGQVIGEALEAGDFSGEMLSKYDDMWRDRLEEKLWRNWMAKEKLVTLSDGTFDEIVQTLSEVGLDKMSTYNILRVIKKKYPELVKEFEELI